VAKTSFFRERKVIKNIENLQTKENKSKAFTNSNNAFPKVFLLKVDLAKYYKKQHQSRNETSSICLKFVVGFQQPFKKKELNTTIMETRKDGSMGKTASQVIAEDSQRNQNANPHAYRNKLSYDNDQGELDTEDVEDIDDDYLDNDDFGKIEDGEHD
jgi:hypothetical protein